MSESGGSILLAGETWLTLGVHEAGFSSYTTGTYEEGHREWMSALTDRGWSVDHVPNHWGSPEFMAWERFRQFWDTLLHWLGGDPRVRGQR